MTSGVVKKLDYRDGGWRLLVLIETVTLVCLLVLITVLAVWARGRVFRDATYVIFGGALLAELTRRFRHLRDDFNRRGGGVVE
jgi:hypothetical protein